MSVDQPELAGFRAAGLATLKQDGLRANVVDTDTMVSRAAPDPGAAVH